MRDARHCRVASRPADLRRNCEWARTWPGRCAGDPDEQSSLEWVVTLAEQHPDDPLVVAPLVLRLYRLQPGQAMNLPHEVPHAYLAGVEGEDPSTITHRSCRTLV